MKLFIASALISLSSLTAPLARAESSSDSSTCAGQVIRAYRPIIDRPPYADKYKHCSMSCVLALQCGAAEAWSAGVLKELYDIFTPGDADLKDLRADGAGIRLARRGQATKPQECYVRCSRLYPNPLFDFR